MNSGDEDDHLSPNKQGHRDSP